MFAPDPIISPHQVLDLVSSAYGVSVHQLRAQCRSQSIAFARKMAMHLLCLLEHDRTTVLHGHNSMQRLSHVDSSVRQQIEFLSSEIRIKQKQAGGMESGKNSRPGPAFSSTRECT